LKFYSFNQKDIFDFVKNVFVSYGLNATDSEVATKVLSYADKNGFSTHGIANLERIYITKILNKEINCKAQVKVIKNEKAIAVLDGNNGLGLVVGDNAMNIAIQKAKEFGVGITVVRNSSHFGSAGYYSTKALSENMIGFSMTNLGSQGVAPPVGGIVNMIGTNPISVSAPAKKNPPYILDMSTTVAATGKIKEAARQGKQIPKGWLIDKNGESTTDPIDYIEQRGYIQFLGGSPETGGNKGYGLALLVDILCGILSGADVGPNENALIHSDLCKNDYNIGHFFMAINIEAFQSIDNFKNRMDSMLEALLNCPTNTNSKQVLYPGYLESTRKQENIVIDELIVKSLKNLSRNINISIPEHKLLEECDLIIN